MSKEQRDILLKYASYIDLNEFIGGILKKIKNIKRFEFNEKLEYYLRQIRLYEENKGIFTSEDYEMIMDYLKEDDENLRYSLKNIAVPKVTPKVINIAPPIASPKIPQASPKVSTTATPKIPSASPKVSTTATPLASPEIPQASPKVSTTATPKIPQGITTVTPKIPSASPKVSTTTTPLASPEIPQASPKVSTTTTPKIPQGITTATPKIPSASPKVINIATPLASPKIPSASPKVSTTATSLASTEIPQTNIFDRPRTEQEYIQSELEKQEDVFSLSPQGSTSSSSSHVTPTNLSNNPINPQTITRQNCEFCIQSDDYATLNTFTHNNEWTYEINNKQMSISYNVKEYYDNMINNYNTVMLNPSQNNVDNFIRSINIFIGITKKIIVKDLEGTKYYANVLFNKEFDEYIIKLEKFRIDITKQRHTDNTAIKNYIQQFRYINKKLLVNNNSDGYYTFDF
jgi:hypothetical protein